ncbi:hypothetical protein MKX03_015528, partial [Papaver bracteatum]
MDALVAFRVKVEHPDQGKFEQLCRDIAKSATAFSVTSSTSSSTETSARGHMEAIEESNESSTRGSYSGEESNTRGSYAGEHDMSNKGSYLNDDLKEEDEEENEEMPLKIIIPAHLEILNNVKINKASGTPRSTIKGILKKNGKNGELSFNRKNLKRAEEQLKSAFVHFYHKLQLLKSFSYLNLLAFSKTMKKYDK